MRNYIGEVVQLIYIDSKRNVTIRNVKILIAGDTSIKAYCYQAQAIRTFKRSGVVDLEVLRWQAS